MRLNTKFIHAIKLSNESAFKIAWRAGANPSKLSQLIDGIDRVRPNDPRILAVAAVLGVSPEDCFIESDSKNLGVVLGGGQQ